jgi:hypothetical protein
VWQAKHCCASSGRIRLSKCSASTDSGFDPIDASTHTAPFLIHSERSAIFVSLRRAPPIGILSAPV